MKKLLLIGMTLMMMNSCVKHPEIYNKLTEEEAAAIPYQLGQIVDFLDQNSETLTFQVTRDITYPYNEEQYHNAIYGEVSTPSYYYCYARTVVLTCVQGSKQLCFTVLPQKEFIFSFVGFGSDLKLNGYLSPNDTYQIYDTEHIQVHHEILYSHYTDELLYDWYYSEELGLLNFKKGDFSITRIL